MKFSIVTPAYNMERYIAYTIKSVLSQEGDFEIEYIVMDDGGKDRSADIAEEYARKVSSGEYPLRCKGITIQVVRQENTGMYEAINRGFARATGDIYAWINADDLYQPGAFAAIATTFAALPNIEWLKGICSIIEEEGSLRHRGECYLYRRDWLMKGIYGMEAYFVQQDAVFWRAELWKKVAPMPKEMRSAADYWLWLQMAKHAKLWVLDYPVSCFRKREGQISKGIAKYKAEQRMARPVRPLAAWPARLFFASKRWLPSALAPMFVWLYPHLFGREEYVALVEGKPEIRLAQSYIC